MADSSDRVAELKKKMQEAAAKRAQEQAAAAAPAVADAAPAAVAEAAPAAVAEAAAPAASAQEAAVAVLDAPGSAAEVNAPEASGIQPVADALAQAEAADHAAASSPAASVPAASVPAVAAPSLNGASDHGDPEIPRALTPEELEKREYSRRELLTYAWGGALALVGGAVGVGLFGFMYPRFRAGEFGGAFFIAASELPAVDVGPVGFSSGKFWLVQSETEGARALYMVCTHLGCLYKWEASNFRFECPCHGSKFSKDGYYIEGPAPRSLDTFATTVEGETITVDTGAKTLGAPSTESPARLA